MTIQECYANMGGDFASLKKRLGSEPLISKLNLKFLETTEFTELGKAIQNRDWKAAFMLAHTLKGVALNLSYTGLAAADSTLTELLRPQVVSDPAKAEELYRAVQVEYDKVCKAIRDYKDSL